MAARRVADRPSGERKEEKGEKKRKAPGTAARPPVIDLAPGDEGALRALQGHAPASGMAPAPSSPDTGPGIAAILVGMTPERRRAAIAALEANDARESFAAFCGLIDIPQAPPKAREALDEEGEGAVYAPVRAAPAAHIALLQDLLQKVETGAVRRLMVFMPPGGAKSTYCSVCFPAWFLGRAPGRHAIVATYAGGLARKMGRRARAITRQALFRGAFQTGPSREAQAADAWALDNGSELMAGGIRAGMTGNRADLIVIDDPIKGREEADSAAVRERTWEEFRDSLRTRLKPGGRIVIVQTRWHEDDLAGRLLPEGYDGESGPVTGRDGETWQVVSIPAEAERDDDPLGRRKGEMFWPEWFPAEHWTPFRADPRGWQSLYQQRPRPDEGGFFQRAWFRRFRPAELPAAARYVITSDYATRDGAGDFTTHQVWALDARGEAWLAQAWRAQASSDVWIEALLDLVADYRGRGAGPVRCVGEKGVIWRAIEPALRLRMRERRISARIDLMNPGGGDKAARARGFQAMARAGRIHVPDDMDGDCFVDELAGFPTARWDDQVDAAALLGRVADGFGAGAGREVRAAFAEGGEVW